MKYKSPKEVTLVIFLLVALAAAKIFINWWTYYEGWSLILGTYSPMQIVNYMIIGFNILFVYGTVTAIWNMLSIYMSEKRISNKLRVQFFGNLIFLLLGVALYLFNP